MELLREALFPWAPRQVALSVSAMVIWILHCELGCLVLLTGTPEGKGSWVSPDDIGWVSAASQAQANLLMYCCGSLCVIQAENQLCGRNQPER